MKIVKNLIQSFYSIIFLISSVQHLSVNYHQDGEINVITPSSSTSYTSYSTTSMSKSQLVSPLAVVSPQTMVDVPSLVVQQSLASNTITQKGLLNCSSLTRLCVRKVYLNACMA